MSRRKRLFSRLLLLLFVFVVGISQASFKIIDFNYTLPNIPEQDNNISQDPDHKKLNDGGVSGGGATAIFGSWDSSKPIIIDVDMKLETKIEKISLWTTEDNTNQHVARYKIFKSEDNINWTELCEVANPEPRLTENPPSRKIYPVTVENLNLRTRYLRIQSYRDRGAYQQVLAELEIFGQQLPHFRVENPVAMPWRGEELEIVAEAIDGTIITVEVINPADQSIVKTLVAGVVGETVTTTWDGKDEAGNFAAPGVYQLQGTFSRAGNVREKLFTVFLDFTAPRNTTQIKGLTYDYPADPKQDQVAVDLDPERKKLTDGGITWGASTAINSGWQVKDKQIIVLFDLKKIHELHEVKLWTEEFAQSTRLSHYQLYVSEDGENFTYAGSSYNHVSYRLFEPEPKEHFSLDAKLNARARYLKVVVFPDPSSRIGNHFVCEVELWGEAIPQLEVRPSAFSPALEQRVQLSFEATLEPQIKITSATGEIVRTLSPGALSGLFSWDGKNDSGEIVADGIYRIRFETCEKIVEVKSQGPATPELSSPLIPTEGILEHNQNFLQLTGKAQAQTIIKVFSTEGAEEALVAEGASDLAGNFSLNVPLQEGDNQLRVMAVDELGNPSIDAILFTVNYDSQRPFGIPTIVAGELLSPKNEDGYLDELRVSFYLKPAGTAYLRVLDATDRVVTVQEIPTTGEEELSLAWDGKDADGFALDGLYTYTVGILALGEEIPFFTRTIEIDNTAPQDPILLYPANDNTITNLEPKLKWEKVRDAAYYLVYLGQAEDLTSETPVQIKGSELALNLAGKGRYWWLVKAVDAAGNVSQGKGGTFLVGDLDTSTFNLSNFAMTPNPFTPGIGRREELAISFSLLQAGEVELSVYNLAGKLVQKLSVGNLPAGDHLLLWDGTDRRGKVVEKGTYLLQLTAKNPLWGPVAAVMKPVLVLK